MPPRPSPRRLAAQQPVQRAQVWAGEPGCALRRGPPQLHQQRLQRPLVGGWWGSAQMLFWGRAGLWACLLGLGCSGLGARRPLDRLPCRRNDWTAQSPLPCPTPLCALVAAAAGLGAPRATSRTRSTPTSQTPASRAAAWSQVLRPAWAECSQDSAALGWGGMGWAGRGPYGAGLSCAWRLELSFAVELSYTQARG